MFLLGKLLNPFFSSEKDIFFDHVMLDNIHIEINCHGLQLSTALQNYFKMLMSKYWTLDSVNFNLEKLFVFIYVSLGKLSLGIVLFLLLINAS